MGCGARKYFMCEWVAYKCLPFKNMLMLFPLLTLLSLYEVVYP